MSAFYITINSAGDKEEVESSAISAGVADAGKVVALNADGLIDESMLNVVSYQSILTNVSGNYALDIATYNKFELTLLGDTEITYDTSGMDVNDTNADITIVIRQSTGGHTPSFEYGTVWPQGDVPDWSVAPGARDVLRGFHLHTSTLWYMREEGYSYTGVILGVMDLAAAAIMTPVGSFVRTAEDFKSGSATIIAAGSLIQLAASDMVANAATTIVGTHIWAGNNDQAGSAWITAGAVVEYTGVSDVVAEAAVAVLGGIITGGSVDAVAAATVTPVGQSKTYISGAAPLIANATAAPAAVITSVGAIDMTANTAVTAAGISSPAEQAYERSDFQYWGDNNGFVHELRSLYSGLPDNDRWEISDTLTAANLLMSDYRITSPIKDWADWSTGVAFTRVEIDYNFAQSWTFTVKDSAGVTMGTVSGAAGTGTANISDLTGGNGTFDSIGITSGAASAGNIITGVRFYSAPVADEGTLSISMPDETVLDNSFFYQGGAVPVITNGRKPYKFRYNIIEFNLGAAGPPWTACDGTSVYMALHDAGVPSHAGDCDTDIAHIKFSPDSASILAGGGGTVYANLTITVEDDRGETASDTFEGSDAGG